MTGIGNFKKLRDRENSQNTCVP